ncbi:MAG: hypothetical protein ACM3SQ_07390 [Betaproteobacteria bacterium]
MALARADLESLLRARQLDRTLTTALAPVDPHDEQAVAPTGLSLFDARLGGGFPRGQLSELVGARSAGRTSVMLQALAAATARGELVALVDALDMFDVESAVAAGVDLRRVLWVRGFVSAHPGLCRDSNQRALEQVIRALALVLQAGVCGLVVLDVAEAPADAMRRLPFTTWLRLQRIVEGGRTACVLAAALPVARSSAGLTVRLEGTGRAGIRTRIDARVVHARARQQIDDRVSLTTIAPEYLDAIPGVRAESAMPASKSSHPESHPHVRRTARA